MKIQCRSFLGSYYFDSSWFQKVLSWAPCNCIRKGKNNSTNFTDFDEQVLNVMVYLLKKKNVSLNMSILEHHKLKFTFLRHRRLFSGAETLCGSHEHELDLPRFVLTLFELQVSSSSDALASLFCLAASFCLKTFRVNVLNEDPD